MSVARLLLGWYRKHGRDLPWRKTMDPYHIFVSEIMLQQTQVSRVLDFYDQWLNTFPNWKLLAKATNAEVIRAWSGLGYNRRAIMLRDTAVYIAAHGVPNNEEAWRKIKGVGPYTAAALTVFALRRRAYPIDTNIRRVIGRIFLSIPFVQLEDDDRVREPLAELMRAKQFYDVPQALFDIATIYCTKEPNCAACPLRAECLMAEAFLNNKVIIPKQMIKKGKERVRAGKKYPDRIYRGRILALVKEQDGVRLDAVGAAIDNTYVKNDAPWIAAMIERMKNDGLIQLKQRRLYLPET